MVSDYVLRQLARVPSVRSNTAVFVRMDSGKAVINTGATQITVPCVGYYPPIVGDVVQVEWRNGRPAVVGPAAPRNPLGVITGTGSPKAEVTVDGVAYLLPYRAGYTPVVSDVVEVNWTTGVIQGSLSEEPEEPEEPEPPEVEPGEESKFDLTVRARDSGKYDDDWNNWWGGSEVWASNSNDGIWVYGDRVRDAVGSGTVTSVEIYLPRITESGSCSIGTHSYSVIPGGAPSIGSLVTLSPRNGWVKLPVSFGTYLAAGGRGIGVTAPSGGYTKWSGVGSKSSSGALRVKGTR